MLRRPLFGLVSIIVFLQSAASAQPSPLAQQIVASRYLIQVQDGRLSGAGAPVVEAAIAKAHYVLIGQDHGIAEIPSFVSAVCDLTAAQGYHSMAVESGPFVTEKLREWIARKDRIEQISAFEKQFPLSLAFFNMREENDMLAHCAQGTKTGEFHLWGLDQEFVGSPGFLLNQIIASHPGPKVEAEAKRLLAENDEAYKKAAQSHNPVELFMFAAKYDDLQLMQSLLQQQGTPAARSLFNAFLESRDIYLKAFSDSVANNRIRAMLLKRNFLQQYNLAKRTEGQPPKVLFRFGALHLMKGFNPLLNNDIGNFVMELADGEGTQSLHIMIVAMQGSQLHFAGVGVPYAAHAFNNVTDKDSQIVFLKPFFDNLAPGGWTLFDLRALRQHIGSLGNLDSQVERTILGYDLLVVIPTAHPSSQIQ
ncbi:MAG TPA: hypothetical protein VEW69_05660 [Alphaproteobacteria bacterium]|nr:hypothetical protein [Alphaproteobacteria bacterium]